MFIRCMLGCHRTHFTHSMVVSGLPYCMTGLKLMEVRWKYPNWELLLADDLHSELLTIPSAERKSDFTTSSTKKKETGPGYQNWYGWMTAVTKFYAQLHI